MYLNDKKANPTTMAKTLTMAYHKSMETDEGKSEDLVCNVEEDILKALVGALEDENIFIIPLWAGVDHYFVQHGQQL
jgi:hypothetical protein